MAQPRKIGDVLAQLIARRGYARQRSAAAMDAAWREAAGEQFGRFTRAGAVRRGTLEVTVANNLVAQELGFQREHLIEKLARLAPDEPITGIRFRVGNVS
jgi:predicted nucleic acid-binding Zn ribbon protein